MAAEHDTRIHRNWLCLQVSLAYMSALFFAVTIEQLRVLASRRVTAKLMRALSLAIMLPEDFMDIYADSIQNLPAVERLRLVEQIWDGLSSETTPIPLPEWAVSEARRRRDEMKANPKLGVSHDEVWKRINERRDA